MKKQEILDEIEELQDALDSGVLDDDDQIAEAKEQLAQKRAELASLEAPKATGKPAKPKAEPKAKKEPKQPAEPASTSAPDAEDSEDFPPAGKYKADTTKDAEELSCEKLIKEAKARREKNNQAGIIKIIQAQKKSKKGEFSEAELEKKTVPQLKEMAGISKPRSEKLVDDAKRAVDAYTKVPVKQYVKRADTPEKQREIADKAAQLQEKYAKEIATFVKEKEKALKEELEALLS